MVRWRHVVGGVVGTSGVVLIGVLAIAKLLYGGGQPFPLDDADPAIPWSVVQRVSLDMPPGCVTVAPSGRVFFDTHPFAAPQRFGLPHVFELVDGTPRPWPSEADQDLFVAPFGLHADDHGRLWVVEPATLDRSATRLLAFELASGDLLLDHSLPDGQARFAQDLRTSPDGRHLILADTGAFRFTPGQLVVFDIEARQVVRTLRHDSLDPQDWYIRRYDGAKHAVGFGLLTFAVGVDGITFSRDGRWLYYATMSHDTLFRVPAPLLLDPTVSDARLAQAIEAVGDKPQSDGIATDRNGDVLLTDVERGGLVRISETGQRSRVLAHPSIVWADSVEVGPSGSIWLTDSAIPAYLRQTLQPPSRQALQAAGPYQLIEIPRPDWKSPRQLR